MGMFAAVDITSGYNIIKHYHHRILPRSNQGKARRRLVPADALYGRQNMEAKTRQAFAIAILDGSQYGFAGLWKSLKEENGTLLETISTTGPNEIMDPFHDRTPVINRAQATTALRVSYRPDGAGRRVLVWKNRV